MELNLGLILAGALTGWVVGLTGVGGGALMTPLLLLVFGVAPVTAIGTDLWFAALTKLVAVKVHHQHGQVDWVVVKRLWWGSLPLALLVVLAVALGHSVGKVAWLTQAVATMVMVTALGIWLAPWAMARARQQRLGHAGRFMRWQPALTVFAGAVLGVMVALTSVGAGALGAVALMTLYPLRMTPQRLVGTDLAHAVPLALVAGLGYLAMGQVDGHLLLQLLMGSVPAVWLGSWCAQWFKPAVLRQVLAGVLLLVAIGLWLKNA